MIDVETVGTVQKGCVMTEALDGVFRSVCMSSVRAWWTMEVKVSELSEPNVK